MSSESREREWLLPSAKIPSASIKIELVGMKEIARLLDVPRTTASMWHVRRETTGFPSPVATLDMGPVFDMTEIRTWYAERYPDRKEPS